jgi:hypothetical protein
LFVWATGWIVAILAVCLMCKCPQCGFTSVYLLVFALRDMFVSIMVRVDFLVGGVAL